MLFKLIQHLPWLSKIFNIHDGYIPDEESEKDYIFGADKLSKEVIRLDGQWSKYLPENELQKGRYVETMACTSFGLLNALEILAKCKFNLIWNKADRYSAKMSGTGKSGNGMRTVQDITRKTAGLVDETTYPWNRDKLNWNEYYQTVPINIRKIGASFLENYKLGYEKVWCNKQLMMEAIKYSPLYVAGYAWYAKNGLYRSYAQANHAFILIGYVEGSHWLAYDSYSPHIKKLDWDFQFGACYIVTLDQINKEFNQSEIDKLIKRGFKYILRAEKSAGGKGEIYELSNSGLKELNNQEKINEAVKELASRKDLTGISEADYKNLLN